MSTEGRPTQSPEGASDDGEKTVEAIIELLEAGEDIELRVGPDVSEETLQGVIEALREAGADVIVPRDN